MNEDTVESGVQDKDRLRSFSIDSYNSDGNLAGRSGNFKAQGVPTHIFSLLGAKSDVTLMTTSAGELLYFRQNEQDNFELINNVQIVSKSMRLDFAYGSEDFVYLRTAVVSPDQTTLLQISLHTG